MYTSGTYAVYIDRNFSELHFDAGYLTRSEMRYDKTWATENEIIALASLLRCNILVYSSSGTRDGHYIGGYGTSL
jgi:hypothetical protein